MTRDEHLSLLAERTALLRMLAETPAKDVLDRGTLTARLEVVERWITAAGLSSTSLAPDPQAQ